MDTLETLAAVALPTRKPRDTEIDVYGLTHTGKVRKANQDHFLISSLRKQILVHLTSLDDLGALSAQPERVAFLAMVADGVGSGPKGEEASRRAVATIADYVSQSTQCYYTADPNDKEAFTSALMDAAMESHESVVQLGQAEPDRKGMATTLTVWLGVWPRGYLLQVGDSRCYVYYNGKLSQISRDQTMAQELVDQGVLTQTTAHSTRWAHVLSSSIGGAQSAPVVTQLDSRWGQVGMLCTDGLTKHVSDERIAERLGSMTSAKQVCEDLLQDALDGGGSDNITVVVGRAVQREPE
jgi:protein phosphatase